MPFLETQRLILREMNLQDAPALFAIRGDPETMRWYPRPNTAVEVEEGIARQISRYASGSGLLAVILRATGDLIGDCGLVWQEVDGVDEPEIGYRIHRQHQNRGYATEAARAVRDHAFTFPGCDRVISLIRPENLPSRRVAEKSGLTLQRTTFWHGYDHCVYQCLKGEVR